jgi:tetratricopeptide (TPR) repeat protein
MSSIPPNAPPPAAGSPNYASAPTVKQLNEVNVSAWMDVGRLAENMDDVDRAKAAYEMAIKHNHDLASAKKALALLYKDKLKQYDKVCNPRQISWR